MDAQIAIRTANSGHLASLIDLGRTYYPAGHPALTEGFLKWFYLGNPTGPATLIVAHEEELWIGLIALIPVILECSGQMQRACFAVNVLTHPDHRGRNLFLKMIRHARGFLSNEGIWLLGHPNANALRGWKAQKMAFRDPLHVYLTKFRLPFSSVCENRINSLDQLRAIPQNFWTQFADRHDVHLKYTPEFIAWRFLDAPHREYVVSAVKKNDELLGLRVTRRFKGPVDLMVDCFGHVNAFGSLLPSVRRPTIIMHSGLGSDASEVSKMCWKLPVKRQFPFFVTTWDQEYPFDMSGITLAASDF